MHAQQQVVLFKKHVLTQPRSLGLPPATLLRRVLTLLLRRTALLLRSMRCANAAEAAEHERMLFFCVTKVGAFCEAECVRRTCCCAMHW